MEKLISKGRTSTGVVVVEIQGDEKKEHFSFRGVRAGLSWPGPQSPGFFVLVGQSIKKDIAGEYPLRLLKEGQEQIPIALYEKLTDDMGTLFAEEIYTDTSETFRSYVLDFTVYKRLERKRQQLILKTAPFYQDFSHGLWTIRGKINKGGLHIPKESITYDQLKAITREDLKREPEERFFALNALRYVVGSFELSDVVPKPLHGSIEVSIPPVSAWS